jgi:hypothetical protein
MEELTKEHLDIVKKYYIPQIIKFVEFWNRYHLLMNLEEYKYNEYIKIIDKITNNDFNFDNDINKFTNLVNDMYIFIYNYHKIKDNIETELQCCQQVKEYLKLLNCVSGFL